MLDLKKVRILVKAEIRLSLRTEGRLGESQGRGKVVTNLGNVLQLKNGVHFSFIG